MERNISVERAYIPTTLIFEMAKNFRSTEQLGLGLTFIGTNINGEDLSASLALA